MGPTAAAFAPLAGYGLLLGWSVAWPPGPINAEIIRRSLARGFWPGFSVALGASSGDALWALSVALGAGLVFAGAVARQALGALSTALLLVLAGVFFKGAWHGIRAWRAESPPAPASGLDSGRAGYLLGLGMALTSPWNIAFWLAVIGRPEMAQRGLPASLILALSVIFGAVTWGCVLCGAVVVLRVRMQSALWEIGAKSVTGLLMLYFAARSVLRLAGA